MLKPIDFDAVCDESSVARFCTVDGVIVNDTQVQIENTRIQVDTILECATKCIESEKVSSVGSNILFLET